MENLFFNDRFGLNGVTSRYTYDDFGRLTEVSVGGRRTLANEYSVGGGEAQTYINTKTFTESDASRYIYDIQHYDGLFRSVRTVAGASADTHALVSLNEYDQWGRISRAWSPAPVNGSDYPSISEMKNAAVAAYGGDACPYSEMSYLDAPTDSVAWRIGAGNAWHTNGKKKVTSTFTNQPSGALMCKKYTVSDGGLTSSGVWAIGTLRVVAVTDEDGAHVHRRRGTHGAHKERHGHRHLHRHLFRVRRQGAAHLHASARGLGEA